MAQQLVSAGNAVCSGSTAAGFTPAGSAPLATDADELLAALPAGASAELREALQADCCIHYTVAEGHCEGGSCPSGSCCYHAVGPGCGIDLYECLPYPCSKGNFSTGC